MEEYKVNSLIFSSSASVYGDSAIVPIREDFPVSLLTHTADLNYISRIFFVISINQSQSGILLYYVILTQQGLILVV